MPADWSNKYLKDIVVKWFERSRDSRNWTSIFDRFIFLWISFDAWSSNESEASNREDVIEWLESSSMGKSFSDLLPEIDAKLGRLKNLCDNGRIKSHIGKKEPAKLDDPHNFGQVMDVLYRIRNNLFHGYKSPDDAEDAEIVTLAYDIILPLLEPFVIRVKTYN